MAASIAAAAAAGSTIMATDCEQTQDWGDLPAFGSSSDGMVGSEYNEETDASNNNDTVFLSKIPHNRSPEEINDLQKRKEKFQELLEQNNILSTSAAAAAADTATDPTISLAAETKEKSVVTTKKMYFSKGTQIESKKKSKFILLAGPSSDILGGDIAHLLGWDLNSMNVGQFADGETRVEIGESVRGKHVYLICSTSSNDAVMELAFMISALRRSSVKSITAVIPYFGYSRQDQTFRREAVAASDVAIVSRVMFCFVLVWFGLVWFEK